MKWSQHHTVDYREHHGRRPDAQGQRQHGNNSKSSLLPQSANGVSRVLKEIREPAPSPGVPRHLLRHGPVPEFMAGGNLSFFSRAAGLRFFALGKRQVSFDLFPKLFVAPLSPPQRKSHVSLSMFAGFKTPAIAPISFAQRDRSACSSFLPDFVR